MELKAKLKTLLHCQQIQSGEELNMKNVGNTLAAVLLTGMVGCFIVAIVAILNGYDMVAKVSGGGGLTIAVAAKAVTGGKA
jgi:anaerobic glycerol-3-phosphate dehydrogenase